MAKNLLDKIYGIPGLARKGPDNAGIPKVEPNYEIDTYTCYRDTTLEIMRASGSLDILQLCPRPLGLETPDSQKLLSWIPDFSYNIGCIPEHTVVEDMESPILHSLLESTEGSIITASGSSQCHPKLGFDRRTLILKGLCSTPLKCQEVCFLCILGFYDGDFPFDLPKSLRNVIRTFGASNKIPGIAHQEKEKGVSADTDDPI
ncbi:hypothetical protein F5B21DRAFT_504562 [Xylaria acuta]|nr:hypothetical protein F5B21DRAFT_504562 [Xylaria acuta]